MASLLCPFRERGLRCPEAECRFWVDSFGDCVLVVNLMRDERFGDVLAEANSWQRQHEIQQRIATEALEVKETLEAKLEGMVSEESYKILLADLETLGKERVVLQQELGDARAFIAKQTVPRAEYAALGKARDELMVEVQAGDTQADIDEDRITQLEKDLKAARVSLEGKVPRSQYNAMVRRALGIEKRANELQQELQSARDDVEHLEIQLEGLEAKLEASVPREEYRDVVAKRGLLLADHRKLMEELEAARVSLEGKVSVGRHNEMLRRALGIEKRAERLQQELEETRQERDVLVRGVVRGLGKSDD